MSSDETMHNRVRAHRIQRGWSQVELAERAGISRTAVSAIEGNRLVPSVAAALSLARTLGCTVEQLFGLLDNPSDQGPVWAWGPTSDPCRFWQAEVSGRTLLYPAEATGPAASAHDGVLRNSTLHVGSNVDAQGTLVMACCDPAAGLLANLFRQSSGLRLIPFARSTRQAVALLGEGLVHVAGLHLSTGDRPDENVHAVRSTLGEGYRLVRVARWQEGVALAPGLGVGSIQAALRSKLTWIGREPGSGARQCLDELLESRVRPRRMAHDHRGVADAIGCGWADAGVCLRITGEEAGLKFLSVREEAFDLCFAAVIEHDPRIRALVNLLRSAEYRGLLGDLPGYDASDTGEVRHV